MRRSLFQRRREDEQEEPVESLDHSFGYHSPYLEDWDTQEVEARYEELLTQDLEQNQEEWEEDYQGYEEGQTVRIPVQPSIVKSRRIEVVKREAFKEKVNRILFWVVVLVIVFLVAVFYF